MNDKDKCPGCGADRKTADGETPITFKCGSDISEIAGFFRPSWHCLSRQVEQLQAIVEKVALCFPVTIPEGQEEVKFNVPAYIIEELRETVAAKKGGG